MRKVIIIIILLTGVLCGAVVYSPAVSLVHIKSATTGLEIPPGLFEDLRYVLDNPGPQLSLYLSHTDHFYSETIDVSITATNPEAVIYYTTDGSPPSIYSGQVTQPLELTADEDIVCYVIKAMAVNGEEQSSIITHTYFIGETISERFQIPYIFSLSIDDDHLYNYDAGIFIPGRLFDEFMAENPDADVAVGLTHSNYTLRGRESERPVYVEAFTNSGNRVIAQNAGLRVHGGATRKIDQKSLRIIARKEYEPDTGMFNYNIFNNQLTEEDYNKHIMSYDTLILRNFGNDYIVSRLRSPLVAKIAYDAGYQVVSPENMAVVFINGEYYGYVQINAQINEQYLQKLYAAPERSFDIIDGGIRKIETDDTDIEEAFTRHLRYIDEGKTDEAIQAIEEFYDTDNLLFYFAIQTYINNVDWPHNNVKIWRYSGSAEEFEGTSLDGRWRFIMFDMDLSLHFNNNVETQAPDDVSYLRNRLSIPVISVLLQKNEYADKYINYVCDLAFEHYSYDNITNTIQQMDDISLYELDIFAGYYDMKVDRILDSRNRITEFAKKRPKYVLAELQELLGYTDMYKIVSDGSCKINTLNGNEGTYFIECSVPVTPIIERGRAFDYWLVNGKKHYDKDLVVSYKDADINGTVNVQLITREDLPPLFFGDTYDTGELYGFIMYNPNDEVKSTSGLYLSDDINNLNKYRLPVMNVRPGNTLEFIGDNCISVDALLKIGLNFNPRNGEAIFLSDEEGEILDYIIMRNIS